VLSIYLFISGVYAFFPFWSSSLAENESCLQFYYFAVVAIVVVVVAAVAAVAIIISFISLLLFAVSAIIEAKNVDRVDWWDCFCCSLKVLWRHFWYDYWLTIIKWQKWHSSIRCKKQFLRCSSFTKRLKETKLLKNLKIDFNLKCQVRNLVLAEIYLYKFEQYIKWKKLSNYPKGYPKLTKPNTLKVTSLLDHFNNLQLPSNSVITSS